LSLGDNIEFHIVRERSHLLLLKAHC